MIKHIHIESHKSLCFYIEFYGYMCVLYYICVKLCFMLSGFLRFISNIFKNRNRKPIKKIMMEKNKNQFTISQLQNLSKYLIENADILASTGKIKRLPYYPKRQDMADYKWTIVSLDNIGEINMYHTACSSILKIDGIWVSSEMLKDVSFENTERALIDAFNSIKIKKIGNYLDSL